MPSLAGYWQVYKRACTFGRRCTAGSYRENGEESGRRSSRAEGRADARIPLVSCRMRGAISRRAALTRSAAPRPRSAPCRSSGDHHDSCSPSCSSVPTQPKQGVPVTAFNFSIDFWQASSDQDHGQAVVTEECSHFCLPHAAATFSRGSGEKMPICRCTATSHDYSAMFCRRVRRGVSRDVRDLSK